MTGFAATHTGSLTPSSKGAAQLAKAAIARAAFYGSALSATRIAAHYSAGS